MNDLNRSNIDAALIDLSHGLDKLEQHKARLQTSIETAGASLRSRPHLRIRQPQAAQTKADVIVLSIVYGLCAAILVAHSAYLIISII